MQSVYAFNSLLYVYYMSICNMSICLYVCINKQIKYIYTKDFINIIIIIIIIKRRSGINPMPPTVKYRD